MQLTRFDHWLRKKFVYETHIYTLRELANPPVGVAGYKLPEKQGQRFHFKYVTRSEDTAEEMIRRLNTESMMFNTRIMDRDVWYARYLAPEGRSPTWWLVSLFAAIGSIYSVTRYAMHLWQKPGVRENILEALDILKG